MDDGWLVPSGKPLEAADVRVDDPVDVGAPLRDCFADGVGANWSVVPSMAFRLTWGVDRWGRHSVVVPADRHRRRGIPRGARGAHVSIESDGGLLGHGGLGSGRPCALGLCKNGLLRLVRPCAGAVPRRCVNVKASKAAMEAHIPLGREAPAFFSSRIRRREGRPAGRFGIDYHRGRTSPRGCGVVRWSVVEGFDTGKAEGLLWLLSLVDGMQGRELRWGDDLAQAACAVEVAGIRMPCSAAPSFVSRARNGIPPRPGMCGSSGRRQKTPVPGRKWRAMGRIDRPRTKVRST